MIARLQQSLGMIQDLLALSTAGSVHQQLDKSLNLD